MLSDKHIPYISPDFTEETAIERSREFFEFMDQRRSLRFFSDRQVPFEIIENIIATASTAPSGAHKQPWTFCVVQDPEIKKAIRIAAEKEEFENYHGRMSDEWLQDLTAFDTDWHKPFLETAPYLIILFKQVWDQDGAERRKNYYVNESVGIAAGFLITAIHQAGLVTLTHTPSPMNFLQKILGRPENEKAFLLLPVGHPAPDATVPRLSRKPLDKILVSY
jgi:iodotyrosine deiodinase